jgi:hypothetical protein
VITSPVPETKVPERSGLLGFIDRRQRTSETKQQNVPIGALLSRLLFGTAVA